MMSPNTFRGTTLVHVPGVAVGGDAVAGLGDQPGERTQQHTTGRTGHGAVRIGDRHRAVRTRHVHRERRH